MQGTEAGIVALSASVGLLEVTIRGPLPEASRLLQHLQRFESSPVPVTGPPSSSQVPAVPATPVTEPHSRVPSSASSSQPRSLAPSSSVPAVQVHLPGPVPPLPIGGKREVEQSFPQCPTSWVDRAVSLGSVCKPEPSLSSLACLASRSVGSRCASGPIRHSFALGEFAACLSLLRCGGGRRRTACSLPDLPGVQRGRGPPCFLPVGVARVPFRA